MRRKQPAPSSGTVRIDNTTPYEDDLDCQALVAANPDGMTLEQVGEVLGLTRERVRQIEHAAIAKIKRTRRRELFGARDSFWHALDLKMKVAEEE